MPWYARCTCCEGMKAASLTARPRDSQERISEIRPAARRKEPADRWLARHDEVMSRSSALRRALEIGGEGGGDARLARLLADVVRVRSILYLLGRHQRDTRAACPEVVARCTQRTYDWLLLVLARVEDALAARDSAPEEWASWPGGLFEYSDLHVATFVAPLVSQAADECERDLLFESPVRERYFLLFRLESAILALHAGLRASVAGADASSVPR
jgi:hypothetical protein